MTTPSTPPPRPPTLWLTRKIATATIAAVPAALAALLAACAAIASWRPPMPGKIDWALARESSIRFFKISGGGALAVSAFFFLCHLTVMFAAGAYTMIQGKPSSIYTPSLHALLATPRFRPISATPANAALWAEVVSAIPDKDARDAMSLGWSDAADRARELRSSTAMIEERLVALLPQTIPLPALRQAGQSREAAIAALADALLAGDSNEQALEKARLAIAGSRQPASPLSLLRARLGPPQTCSGLAYLQAVTPGLPQPAGACMAMTDSVMEEFFGTGFFMLVCAFLSVFFLGLGFSFLAKAARAWSKARSDGFMADWERQQVAGASNPPPKSPPRRPRL